MAPNLSDRNLWILASILLSISAIVYVFGWTSPFWPEWYPILGSDIAKTTFFFISSVIFLVLFFISLYILAQTTPPPIKPVRLPEDE